MVLHPLLSSRNTHLTTLSLSRAQFDAPDPFLEMPIYSEVCIYPLIGAVHIHIDGVDYGTIGGRRDVRSPEVCAARMSRAQQSLRLSLASYTADILVAMVRSDAHIAPFIHRQEQCHIHAVGTGTHRRDVRELPVPDGYTLHMGETLNDAGAWSSWPDHSTQEERIRYKDHQECFYVVTPGYGLMYLDGTYVNGLRADGVRIVHNDDAFVTPLGSHPIVASPDAWLYYAWVYQSFLQKSYNKWANHGTKQYIK